MRRRSRVMAAKSLLAFFVLYLLESVAAINVPPTVQKCCQTNEVLNVSPMFCALAPNQSSAANFHFDAATRFGRPHCQGDVVIVEYNSKTTSLTLVIDNLIVPQYNNSEPVVRIPADSFCLDNAYDDDLNSTRVWAAWVCQPSSVCEHMPCIQKCCGPSEHLRHVDGIPQCVANMNMKPFAPNFHPMNNSSTPVEVFGAKLHDKCLSYLSDYAVGDFYMLDSKTGQIFNNDTPLKYNQTDYCVDNDDDGNHTLKLYFCHDVSESWYIILQIWIPMVLVMITLVVYMIIPSTSTMIDRAHFRFVLCMFLSYATEAIATLLTETQWWVCWMMCYFLFFISLCYYTWLSVVIFEIYRFYRLKFSGSTMTNRFRSYSIYAWGTASAVTIVGRIFQRKYTFFYVTDTSATSCLHHVLNFEIYGMFVVTILLVMAVMCVLIKCNICKLTREATQQNSDGVYRAQSIKHVRLVFATVAAIVVVIIILQIRFLNIFFLFQILETGPGVFLFIIFVLNRKTLTAIKKKWNQENDDPVSESDSDVGITMTVNQGTAVQGEQAS